MGHWNLKRVKDKETGKTKVCEVYYDAKFRPWGHTEARIRDKIRFWRDWWSKPTFVYPDDFVFDQLEKWDKDLQNFVKNKRKT